MIKPIYFKMDVIVMILIPLRKESKCFANSADYDQNHVRRCLICFSVHCLTPGGKDLGTVMYICLCNEW